MTVNSSSKTSEQLLREIRKLEVRLNEFLKEENIFIENLKKYIGKLRDVCGQIEKLKGNPRELGALRLEIAQALKDVFISEGEVQHERSHLLESYGTLIHALEEQLQNCNRK